MGSGQGAAQAGILFHGAGLATDSLGAGFCTACMTGEYPTAVDVQQAKDVLERVPTRG